MQIRIALVLCALLGALLPVAAAEAQRPRSVPLYTLDGVPERVVNVPGITARTRLDLLAAGVMYNEAVEVLRRQIPRPSMLYELPLSDTLVVQTSLDNIAWATRDRALRSGLVFRQVGAESHLAGQATLLLSADSLSGRLMVDGAHYLIRHIAGQHYLLAVDPGALPPEAAPLPPMPLLQEVDESPHLTSAAADCRATEEALMEVRVLVLYTAAAREGAVEAAAEISGSSSSAPIDGDEAIRDAAEVALGWANQALQNSGALTRFSTSIVARLVDAGYVEPGDGSEALAQLYAPSQALHQAASALRDDPDINADLVALAIEDWDYCGAAPVMIDWFMQRNQTAYSVVVRSCLDVKDNSLGHELAHSMGSAHDHEHARVPGLFRYSYGHAAKAAKLSTMMAYECPDCVRQPSYSNPDAHFVAGSYVPSGCPPYPATSEEAEKCPPAHNVRSLDRAACQVTRWRINP